MVAYHQSHAVKPSLTVTKTTEVSFDVIKDDLKVLVKCRFPSVTALLVANNMFFLATNYAVGMLLCCVVRSVADNGDLWQTNFFCETTKHMVQWTPQELRAREHSQLLEQRELQDFYPLAAYSCWKTTDNFEAPHLPLHLSKTLVEKGVVLSNVSVSFFSVFWSTCFLLRW